MGIITDKITIKRLKEMAQKIFGSLVEVIVNVEKKTMVVNGELHSCEQELLTENGSEVKIFGVLTSVLR